MTDMQAFINMIAPTDTSFMKEQCGENGWIVTINNENRIEVHFDTKGKFQFMFTRAK